MVQFSQEKFNPYMKYSYNAPKFVFPQLQQTETFPDQHEQEHSIITSVVTEVLHSSTTPETSTPIETTTATIIETITESNNTILTAMQDANNTMMNGLEEVTNAMVTTLEEVTTVTSVEANATMVATLEEVTNAMVVEENTNNILTELSAGTSILTETTTELQNSTSAMDWLSHGGETDLMNHNLTMSHKGSFEDEHQTLYIILGVILGILVVISLILLMIYVTYKRRNLYTLQEQSQSSGVVKMVNKPMTSPDDDEQDIEQAIEYDKNCYKF